MISPQKSQDFIQKDQWDNVKKEEEQHLCYQRLIEDTFDPFIVRYADYLGYQYDLIDENGNLRDEDEHGEIPSQIGGTGSY